MRVSPTHYEDDHQRALIQWADARSDVGPYLYAIPNGGARRRVEAARLKGLGVRAGMFDLCLHRARGPWHGLYIEMKRPAMPELGLRRGTVSKEQKGRQALLVAEGYKAVICYSFLDASRCITEYLAEGRHVSQGLRSEPEQSDLTRGKHA